MALVYCGIDEAGYGPILGPLCLGCAVFRLEDWTDGDPAPDLWAALDGAVCREAGDKRRRIAVDDSKNLKIANSSVRRHPLLHLERGVLAFAAAGADGADRVERVPETDAAYLRLMGVPMGPEEWYGGEPETFPRGLTGAEVLIASNALRAAMAAAGVRVLSLQADAVFEGAFNELVEAAGTKSAATESMIVKALAGVWEAHATGDGAGGGASVRVVCDRQGGRVQYGGMLRRAFPDARVAALEETVVQSRYEITSEPGSWPGRRMTVAFRVEAESSHLPVALASMIAKLTREVLMTRLNRYWCARLPELKPTAGYALDARRWLRDVAAIASPGERRALVRRA